MPLIRRQKYHWYQEQAIPILLVGQKGVGKSSLINAAFGKAVANPERTADPSRPVEVKWVKGDQEMFTFFMVNSFSSSIVS